MRYPAWCAVAVLALAVPAFTDDRSEIAECSALLPSKDKAVRERAAGRILEIMGGVEKVARSGADLDAEHWKAFSDACAAGGPWNTAVTLVAAAHTAPASHRERLRALAHRLRPEAGVDRTPAEIDAVLRKNLIDSRSWRCSSGCDFQVSLLGHQAVPAVLALLRSAEGVDEGLACWALAPVVEEEDLPALRDLFVAGKTGIAVSLESLQKRGVRGATEAIFEGVAAGSFDREVARALRSVPDRARAAKAVGAWFADPLHAEKSRDERDEAATLFADLDARETVPLVESWVPGTRSSSSLAAFGHALARLGSREGIRVLVRVVAEKEVPGRCCNPGATTPPGSLSTDGFAMYARAAAVERLAGIAGPAVFVLPEEGKEEREAMVERAVPAFLAWWEASKDALRFDPATGRWTVAK